MGDRWAAHGQPMGDQWATDGLLSANLMVDPWAIHQKPPKTPHVTYGRRRGSRLKVMIDPQVTRGRSMTTLGGLVG